MTHGTAGKKKSAIEEGPAERRAFPHTHRQGRMKIKFAIIFGQQTVNLHNDHSFLSLRFDRSADGVAVHPRL